MEQANIDYQKVGGTDKKRARNLEDFEDENILLRTSKEDSKSNLANKAKYKWPINNSEIESSPEAVNIKQKTPYSN